MRIKANFGQRTFAYTEASRIQGCESDFSQDISETFGLLPFHNGVTDEADTAGYLLILHIVAPHGVVQRRVQGCSNISTYFDKIPTG